MSARQLDSDALSPAKRALLARLSTGAAAAAATQRSAPLTYGQQALWVLAQLDPASTAYNQMHAVQIDGRLDLARLQRCLNQIAAHHAALRSAFRRVDGGVRQIMFPDVTIALPLVDLSALNADEQQAAVWQAIDDFSERPFDLTQPPLWRVLMLRLAAERYIFVHVIHHTISDGRSRRLFWQSLNTLYSSDAATLQPPPDRLTMGDYARMQRSELQGERLAALVQFWHKQLANLPPTALPLDRLRPSTRSYRGRVLRFTLPDGIRPQLLALAQQADTSLYAVLLTACQLLLQRYSGRRSVGVLTLITERTRPQLEQTYGYLVNTVVMRADFESGRSFLDQLLRGARTIAGAFAHSALPFDRLVDQLNVERHANRNPLSEVMFVLESVRDRPGLNGLRCEQLQPQRLPAKFDLDLTVYDDGATLLGELTYAVDLFEHATIKRVAADYHALLTSVVRDPQQLIVAAATVEEASHAAPRVAPEPTPYVAPRTPIEEMVVNIWQELLEQEPIGVEDDFFALGGNSLHIVQLAARIEDLFAVQLDTRAIFEAATPAAVVLAIVSDLAARDREAAVD